MAECLVGFLDALDLRHADLLGMHTGDKVATAFAADFPARVDRLIIAGQTHSLIPEKEERNKALAPSFKRYHAAKGKLNGEAGQLMRDWLAAKLTLDESLWPEKVVSGEAAIVDLFALSEAQSIEFSAGMEECRTDLQGCLRL